MRTVLRTASLVLVLSVLGVATLQGQTGAIPSPESVLGFRPGADFQLATYEESIAYFQRLDEASDHLKMVEAGQTSEGRPFFLALISSPENLAELDRYRAISLRLAHPAGLSDEEARDLAREGKESCTSTGRCTRPRWRPTSTPSSWPTTS